MNHKAPYADDDMPQAKTRKSKLNLPVIWIVPAVAALVAGCLVYQRLHEFGATITIRFDDVEGVKPGQTPLQYRGADIGQVKSVELDENQKFATVEVKLRRNAAAVARDGSSFWIVRPQVGAGNLTGLGTLITGPYIGVLPGQGKPATDFVGVENPPMVIDPSGLSLILLTGQGESLRTGVPIYYRGIEVGAVRETRLSTNAATVEIHCVIRRRYAPLVRSETKFWNVSGLDVRFGLFSGAEVNVESLRSLLIGGIAFATPEDSKGGTVKDGMVFRLYDKAEKEWSAWSPQIAIGSDDNEELSPQQKPTRDLQLPQGNSP